MLIDIVFAPIDGIWQISHDGLFRVLGVIKARWSSRCISVTRESWRYLSLAPENIGKSVGIQRQHPTEHSDHAEDACGLVFQGFSKNVAGQYS